VYYKRDSPNTCPLDKFSGQKAQTGTKIKIKPPLEKNESKILKGETKVKIYPPH
jgi:hypothetical protein